MEIDKAISQADAVSINGSLAGTYKTFGDRGFTAGWSNGCGSTYSDTDVDSAKYFNGYFIIDNDLIKFYTLTLLNPTHPIG